jgi:hypothetical protein
MMAERCKGPIDLLASNCDAQQSSITTNCGNFKANLRMSGGAEASEVQASKEEEYPSLPIRSNPIKAEWKPKVPKGFSVRFEIQHANQVRRRDIVNGHIARLGSIP